MYGGDGMVRKWTSLILIVALAGCAVPEVVDPLPPEPEPAPVVEEEPVPATYRVEPFLLSFADVRENYNQTMEALNEASQWFSFDLPMPDLTFSKSREKLFIHNDHGITFERLAVAVSINGREYFYHAMEVSDPAASIQIAPADLKDLEDQPFDGTFADVHFVEIWIPGTAVSRWSDSIEHIKVIRSVPAGPTVIGGQTNMEAISQRLLFR